MKKFTRPFLLVFGLFTSVMAAWRIVSRLRPMPCPPWMGWLLESPFTRGIQADLLIRRAKLHPGMRVLDAGCGPGRMTVAAAAKVGVEGEVIALDIQPAMLDAARKRAKAAGLNNIRFMLSGLGEMMLPENRFDRVFLVTVLGEIPNQLQAMQEIASCLKPDGIVSITEMFPDPHFQSKCTIRRLSHSAGLMEVSSYGNAVVFTMNFRKPHPGF